MPPDPQISQVKPDQGSRPSFERLECVEHPGAPLEGYCPDRRCSECGVIAGAVRYVRESEAARLWFENEGLKRSWEIDAQHRDELLAENERLRYDAMTVYGIVYGQLTAGIVDDHDRIMRATNELAEAGRRFAPPSDEQEASDA